MSVRPFNVPTLLLLLFGLWFVTACGTDEASRAQTSENENAAEVPDESGSWVQSIQLVELDPAELERWAISDRGVGPLRFGMTPDEAIAAVGGDLEFDEPLPGSQCIYGTSPSMPQGLYLMSDEGHFARVDVTAGLPFRTPEGIGILSTLDDARAAYGDRAVVRQNKYGAETDLDIRVIDEEADFGYVFESSEGVIHAWRAGRAEQVAWVEGCS